MFMRRFGPPNTTTNLLIPYSEYNNIALTSSTSDIPQNDSVNSFGPLLVAMQPDRGASRAGHAADGPTSVDG